jgi:hypothetical protein
MTLKFSFVLPFLGRALITVIENTGVTNSIYMQRKMIFIIWFESLQDHK